MLKIVSLLFALMIVPYTATTDVNDKLLASMGLLNNVIGKCLSYPTVSVPSELVELNWKTVKSITSLICTKFEIKGTVPLSTSVGSKTGEKQVVSYLNEDGSITKNYYIRQNVLPGKYVLKEYSPNNTDFNSLHPTFAVSILKITTDTLLVAVCPVKPNTHKVLTIFTTTGEITSSVKTYEDYAKEIGITDDFQALNLTKCNKFYAE